MYDNAYGLEVINLYLKLLSHFYFSFKNNTLYKYLGLIKYYCRHSALSSLHNDKGGIWQDRFFFFLGHIENTVKESETHFLQG